MSALSNDKQFKPSGRKNENMDGGPIGNQLNSDNSFSDNGLENARKLKKALNTTNN
ncbi:hypothetical protein [Bacillus sp. EB600]|uniref:hypothetical protein n=1 Tax=Bacillus sp. EB600 TaxID=2806345 RepID=UPI00210B74BE|nr:hypothetical protein [Bacillus sp. EB600]MCQ6280408.1 hypothetical protein [Bacillus sp. EB600]